MGLSGGTPNMKAPGPSGSGITLTTSILWAIDYLQSCLQTCPDLDTRGCCEFVNFFLHRRFTLIFQHLPHDFCSFSCCIRTECRRCWQVKASKLFIALYKAYSLATWSPSWPTVALHSLLLCLRVVDLWQNASPAHRLMRCGHLA